MTVPAIPGPDESYLVSASQQSFDEMMADVRTNTLWVFDSEDLIEGDRKHILLGIPFFITEVAYRYTELPDPANPKHIISLDYVSVTARLGSEDWMKKAIASGRVPNVRDVSELPPDIEPDGLVVFNDGSTGVRRQLTGVLHHAGVINVGGSHAEHGNARYDRRYFEWASYNGETDDDGKPIAPIITEAKGKPLKILALKGLRASEYAYGQQMATTYYLG